ETATGPPICFFLCSHPPLARGPRAHRGRREGAAPCLDDSHPQTSPSPRGRARTLTHARCHRHNHQGREGRRGDTLSGSLLQTR
ncbi:hypothetical protein P7K49_028118, partial [Saguinus oedipus]